MTGRVCPHPCEEACNRGQYDEAISIRALERFAADAGAAGLKRLSPLPPSGRRIAVVGSGRRFERAWFSALLGHEVTVSRPRRGGRRAAPVIPDFRLPKDVADRELGHILDLGVRVLTNTEVGRDVSLAGDHGTP